MKRTFRLFTFVNFYLSQIQQGIQTAHVVSDMSLEDNKAKKPIFDEWARNDKTIIVLNGGNTEMMEADYAVVKRLSENLVLPVARFHEDEASLGGVFTAFGIIVPKEIYEARWDATFQSYVVNLDGRYCAYDQTTAAFELLRIMKSKRLA